MKRMLLAAAAAAVLLSGCAPSGREPDNLALVRVLGVDGASPVELTAVCGGTDQRDGSRGACVGETFGQAREWLPWSGENELALTSVSYLLVGRDADLEAVLFAVLEDAELGASAKVWLAGSGAKETLALCRDPASDLELLSRQGIGAPTVAQALASLSTEGKVILPVAEQSGGRLIWRGEELWKTSG